MLNTINLCGRIVNDLEVRTSNQNKKYVRFGLAVPRDQAAGSSGEKKTDFLPAVAFDANAEFLGRYFKKGSRVLLQGTLQTDEYRDTEGKMKKTYEIIVKKVWFVEIRPRDFNGQDHQQTEAGSPVTDDGCPF
ncbi:MAG: single-stranded DNA-binding protein [Ruminococcus sp.]|nr:single-stranded DNA-binding protein [Ruminococcus sp.]